MSTKYRTENDLLGSREIPAQALWGIHTLRAVENFPLSGRRVHPELVKAYGAVKLACTRANRELGLWGEQKADAIESACLEMQEGRLDEHIAVDALQGGAGTSTNMNVNEVLANRALELLGQKPGEYEIIHPLDDLNRHQSTNDTYPTALRVAAIALLRLLEKELVLLLESFQEKEKEFADVVKVARTQMQDAVLTTLGREMGAYAEAFGRDRWRVYKCEERLRVVNLGGTAVGTGLGAPRKFIFRVVEHLQQITGMGLARAENLVEGTQNADAFIEVSGILKACAGNLLKVANDLRLLSSGPRNGLGEIRLPARQAGSSMMPGKVNPVIPEAVAQAAIRVMANDQALTQAASGGNLDLNQFMPLVADSLLDSLLLLANACSLFSRSCVRGLEADRDKCRESVESSTAVVTALVEILGYERAQELAMETGKTGKTVREIVMEKKWMKEEDFNEAISPEAVTRLGSPDVRRTE
jgi:aspartate ammonia-lyase